MMWNISKVYVGDIISKIMGVVTMLILIRGLTQADYASYVVFSGVAVLFVSLVGSGINSALIRFSAEYFSSTGEKPYMIYILSLGIQIIIFLPLLLCTLVFPGQVAMLVLGKPELANLLPVSMLFGLGNILLLVGQSILQAEEKFNSYIVTLWLKQGLIFVIVVGLWFSRSLGFQWVVWGVTLGQLVVGIGIIFYSLAGVGTLNWLQQIEREKSLVRYFLSASGWLIAYFVAVAGFSRMDVLMLSRFASEAELANYGVAFQYYSLVLLVLGSVTAVLRPKFSRVEMQDPIRQSQFLVKWLRYSALIGAPIMLFIVFGKPFFVFLNGIQYERSFSMLAILAVGVWLSLMLSPLVNILMSRKDFRFLFLLGVNAFLVSLVVFYVGIQTWGGLGAAIAVVLVHNVVLQVPILWRVLL